MMRSSDWPRVSGRGWPKIRSAPGFQKRMTPWRSATTIASAQLLSKEGARKSSRSSMAGACAVRSGPSAAGGGVARFEVIEEKAQVVRQIFRRVGHERVSLSAVSRRLFEAGVPSPTGNAHWSRSMLWTPLSNPAYAGQAVFGKNTSIPWRPPLRPARGRARVPKRPFRQIPASREHWVRIAVPAMIEAELFESAQEQLAENRRRHRQRCAGVRYLLQGLLVCRKCGYAFCGRWQPRYPREPGRGYHYYRCSGTESHRFHGQRRCDARVMPVAPLDTAVWEQVCRLLENPARVLHEYE